MPVYMYSCGDGHRTERLRSIANRNEPVPCACGQNATLVIVGSHVPPDGVYSYAPNIGDAERFEMQRQAMKDGTKVIPRSLKSIEVERHEQQQLLRDAVTRVFEDAVTLAVTDDVRLFFANR